MKDIKLIIFDLDGTLVDAYPAIISSFNYTLKKLGFPPRDALTIRRAVGWGDQNLLKPFMAKKDLLKALIVYRRHHKTALLRSSRIFPFVKALLAKLKAKGYKLAVASNRPTKFSLILIRHLGLAKYFSFCLCADKVKHGKPHPDILKAIMRKFKVEPKDTIYVGDMTIDALAGRRAKVKTIIVTTGSSTRQEIIKVRPFRIIRRIADLPGLLRVLS